MSLPPALVQRSPLGLSESKDSLTGHVRPLLVLAVIVCVFYAPFLASGTTHWDGLEVHYSAQRYFSDAIRNGYLPFWTPYVFSGFPFLADLQVGAWYPLNWPFFLVGIEPNSINVELLLNSLIACGGAYALGMRLTGQPIAAVGTAIFYGLSGFFAAHSQHIGIVQAAAWLPWLVLAIDMLAEHVTLRRLALAALLGAMLALPGHFQTALYAFCGVAVWAVLELLVRPRWDRAIRIGVALLAVGVWGGLLSAVMILPGLELARQSLRARLSAGDLNLGFFQPDSLLTLVQPNYFGMLLGSSYTGPGDVTQHYFYAGILLLPLAAFGAWRSPRARRMAVFIGLPFIWYALGPAGGLFTLVSRLPGFKSVELPMHGWFLPALGLAILGGAGLAELSRRVEFEFKSESESQKTWLPVLVLGVVFLDVLTFNALLNRLAYSRVTAADVYAAPIQSLETALATAQVPVERMYGPPMTSVGYRNHPLQLRVEATYGYNPLALAAYADYQAAAEGNARLIDGLAATHFVETRPDGEVGLQPNPSALPLAYFARSIRPLPDAGAVAENIVSLDPALETLVVEPAPRVESDPSAIATVVERGEDHLTIRYRSSSPNLLRVAIPRFPGWRAALNGQELPLLTVDHALLGVVVPPGEGDIALWYAPRWFGLGAAVSGLAMLGVIAAFLFSDRVTPYLSATALAGEPTPPRRFSGLPTNRNS
jgi:hypothetical protein